MLLPRALGWAALALLLCGEQAFACGPIILSPYVPWTGLVTLALLTTPPAGFALRFRGSPGSRSDLVRCGVAALPVGCLAAAAASAVLEQLFWESVRANGWGWSRPIPEIPAGAGPGQALSAGAVTVVVLATLLWARRKTAAREGDEQVFAELNTPLHATSSGIGPLSMSARRSGHSRS